jgi:hypothetical protein
MSDRAYIKFVILISRNAIEHECDIIIYYEILHEVHAPK